MAAATPFERWLDALESRHLADLRFGEVSRALRAVSSAYVERRHTLGSGAALSGAGKRTAFALFYGPLHFLIVREVVRNLMRGAAGPSTIVDLGCGTGAAGAAWGALCQRPPTIFGIDRHPWALGEAADTYRLLGLRARTRLGDISTAHLPAGAVAFLAAFALNELPDAGREALLTRLVDRAKQGSSLLVVEPLARGVAPWWPRWAAVVEQAGGRVDEWRFRIELPPIVLKLDRAAGLDHRELTARTMSIGVD